MALVESVCQRVRFTSCVRKMCQKCERAVLTTARRWI